MEKPLTQVDSEMLTYTCMFAIFLPPSLSLTILHSTTDGAETGERDTHREREKELLWVASQWSTQAPLLVSHAAFLYTSCPRPPTLHLHSNAATAKLLRLLIHYSTQPLSQLKSHR